MDDRLYRSRSDRMIAGVAGGLAERYDLDPSLVRIGWALVILGTGGLFFLLYIVMAIVVPEDPLDTVTPMPPMPLVTKEVPMTNAMPTTDPSTTGPSPDPATDGAAGTAAAPAPSMTARDARRAARRERRSNNGPMIFGAILVIVGVLAFGGQVFPDLD